MYLNNNIWRFIMKKIILFVLFLALFGLIMSCSTGGDDSTDTGDDGQLSVGTKILPPKYMVDVPNSLTATSNTGSNGKSDTRAESNYYAYDQIKSAVSMIKGTSSIIGLYFVIIDELLINAKPSDSVVEGGEIVLTESFVNKLKVVFKDSGDEWFDADDYSKMIGTKFELPPFKYNTTTGIYSYIFEQLEEETGDGASFLMKLLWSSDKTKVKIIFEDFSEGEKSSTIFSYDDTSKISKIESIFVSGSDKFTNTISIKEKEGTNNGGAFVNFESSGSGFKYSASGYADDNGGYLVSSYELSSGVVSTKFEYKEAFDGNGNMIYAQYKDENTEGYIDIPDFSDSDFDYEDYEYDDYYADYDTYYDDYEDDYVYEY